jgi:tripeptide aminopeptidase
VRATAEEIRRCIDDACAICEIPAPTGDERRRAEWVADRLREAGLEPGIDASGSVLAAVEAGDRAGGGPILFAAHLDTVFPDIDEITVRRDGNVLHAPGIGDNSLGVAALLFLARRLGGANGAGGRSRRPVVLAATTGEEGFGNLRGARSVVDACEPAEFVAIEGGGVGELVTRGVGSARYKLIATAPGGHSWRDRGEPSAVHALVDLLHAILADPGSASVNVGAVHGGAGINVLAPSAEATIEFRDPDTSRLDAVAARLTRAAAAAAGGNGSMRVEELGRRPGGATPEDHPLVRAAVDAAVAAGLPRPRAAESSTDANAALGAGIPAITVGLCRSVDPHTPEERIDVADLGPSLTALADLVGRRTSHA